MIGAALALIALGIVLLFFAPWVAIPVGIVGLVLFVANLAGFGFSRREAQGTP